MTASSAAFTIREANQDDLPAIVAIINTHRPEPYTLEDFAELLQRLQHQPGFFRQWVLEDSNGRLSAALRLHHLPLTEGEMLSLPVVALDARNRGYGSALLALAVDTASSQGAAALSAPVHDTHPDVREWAKRRGFAASAHRFESVLDLTTFDDTPHVDLERRLTSAGITVQTMQTLGRNQANWTRLYDFFAKRIQETPDYAGLPPMTVEQAQHELRGEPNVRSEEIMIATRSGEWLGISVLMRHSRGAYNLFTGVSPQARGKGLATVLKVEVIRRARAAGFTRMLTQNLSENAPMLAVNRRLGFEARRGIWTLRRTLS